MTGKKEAENKPQTVILFIDEIDAIGSRKDPLGMKDTQTVSQLLTCMDGLLENHNVLVLGITAVIDIYIYIYIPNIDINHIYSGHK